MCFTDQHNPAPSEDEFKNAISGTKHTVCVLDTLKTKPVALSRIWCLYEYLHTIVSKHELQVFLPDTVLSSQMGHVEQDVSLAEKLVGHGVDVRAAQASRPEDITSIQAAIERLVGFDAMQDEVLQALRSGVLRACGQFRTFQQLMYAFTEEGEERKTHYRAAAAASVAAFRSTEHQQHHQEQQAQQTDGALEVEDVYGDDVAKSRDSHPR